MLTILPQLALISGILLSFFIRNEFLKNKLKKTGASILQLSIILLGTSLNFKYILDLGIEGILITFSSILIVFALGFMGRRLLKIPETESILISMGTAICGGSAIWALAPIIQADTHALTISIGIVYLLNSVSILIFPFLGKVLSLSQEQFGAWAALAIHDTSSVVAAAATYGEKALQEATTLKLIRALWIIPVTLYFSMTRRSQTGKITIPWFIGGFLLSSVICTFLPVPLLVKETMGLMAKIGFSITLFCIGINFDLPKLKAVGLRPLLYGSGLWIIVCCLSLIFIKLR